MNDESRFIGEIENRVLAHLINSPPLIDDIVDQLTAEDFYFDSRQPDRPYTPEDVANGELRRDCFGAILRVRESGGRVSETTVRRELVAKGYDRDDVAAYFRAIRTDNVYPIFQYDVRRMARYAESRVDESAEESPAPASTAGRFTAVPITAAGPEGYVVPYIIPGLLPERQPTIVSGPPKSLKTSLAAAAGIDIVSGGCFLGRPEFQVTKPRRVLFASAESGVATLRETFARICKAKGLDPVEVELAGFTLLPAVPNLQSSDDVRDFERLIETTGAEVVVLDPLYKAMGGASGHTLNIAGEQLHPITEACDRQGATLVALHHTVKGGKPGSLDLRSVVGAGVAEWARAWVIVDPLAAFKPATGQHRLRLNVGGSSGHCSEWRVNIREGHQSDAGGRVWDVDAKPIVAGDEPAPKATSLSNDCDAVLSAMRELGQAESAYKIRQKAKLSGDQVKAALDSLVTAGRVIKSREKKGRKTCDVYEIAEAVEEVAT